MAYIVSSDQYVIQTSVSFTFLRMAVGKVSNGNCRMVHDPTISKLAFAVQPSNSTSAGTGEPEDDQSLRTSLLPLSLILLWRKWFFNVFNFENIR